MTGDPELESLILNACEKAMPKERDFLTDAAHQSFRHKIYGFGNGVTFDVTFEVTITHPTPVSILWACQCFGKGRSVEGADVTDFATRLQLLSGYILESMIVVREAVDPVVLGAALSHGIAVARILPSDQIDNSGRSEFSFITMTKRQNWPEHVTFYLCNDDCCSLNGRAFYGITGRGFIDPAGDLESYIAHRLKHVAAESFMKLRVLSGLSQDCSMPSARATPDT